jgi:hypothetical protein
MSIVDDSWLTIGSANLNEYLLFNHTEMNVVTHHATMARATPAAAVERTPGPADCRSDGDPRALVDSVWRPIAESQLRRRVARRRGRDCTTATGESGIAGGCSMTAAGRFLSIVRAGPGP